MISVDEPFARPPRLVKPVTTSDWTPDSVGEADGGIVDVSSVHATGVAMEFGDAERVDLDGCQLSNVSAPGYQGELHITASVVERSDLSRADLRLVRSSQLTGVKLVGTDFSGGLIRDTMFTDCVLRLANFRMATFERVAFHGCVFEDVDAYSTTFIDVDFAATGLQSFNIDHATAERVDLRECTAIDLAGIRRLDGFLVSEHQLPALTYQLAAAVGLGVEDEGARGLDR